MVNENILLKQIKHLFIDADVLLQQVRTFIYSIYGYYSTANGNIYLYHVGTLIYNNLEHFAKQIETFLYSKY